MVLEVENDILREEKEKLKKQLEKQNPRFSVCQMSFNPVNVQYLTEVPDAATVLFLEALLSYFELQYHSCWTVQIKIRKKFVMSTAVKTVLDWTFGTFSSFKCSTDFPGIDLVVKGKKCFTVFLYRLD